MNLENLKFVKNIDDPERWAYADWHRVANSNSIGLMPEVTSPTPIKPT